MRVGLISDTHGSKELMVQASDLLMGFSLDQLLHVGDDYGDGEYFIQRGYRLFRIPGTWCSEYQTQYVDNRVFLELNGWRFFLTHTPESDVRDRHGDVSPEQVLASRGAHFFCHGHTHHPRVVIENGVLVINPGHLKKGDNRGYVPSVGILDLSEHHVRVRLIELVSKGVFIDQNFIYDNENGMMGA